MKKVGATFQRARLYSFYDIKQIVELYLDDLLVHSQQQEDHSGNLRHIFLRCRHYRIRLNPHTCVFCVEAECLLGFVVYSDGIRIDPLNISSIMALPPPTDIIELQILQGKENFLHRFVCHFVEKTHGYMHLLKKNTPFLWDDQAQRDFYNLKHAITHSPLLHFQIIQEIFCFTLPPPLLPLAWS